MFLTNIFFFLPSKQNNLKKTSTLFSPFSPETKTKRNIILFFQFFYEFFSIPFALVVSFPASNVDMTGLVKAEKGSILSNANVKTIKWRTSLNIF